MKRFLLLLWTLCGAQSFLWAATTTGTLSAAGEAGSIPLSLQPNQVMSVDLQTNPPEAADALRSSMRIYNAAGEVIESGASGQIVGGPNPAEHPVRAQITSSTDTPVQWTLQTDTRTPRGLFNRGGSDEASAQPLGGQQFMLTGVIKAPAQSGNIVNNVVAKRTFNIKLRAGEKLIRYLSTSNAVSPLDPSAITPSAYYSRFEDFLKFGEQTMAVNGANSRPTHRTDGPSTSFGETEFYAPYTGDYTYVITIYQETRSEIFPPLSISYKIGLRTSLSSPSPDSNSRAQHPSSGGEMDPQLGASENSCGGCGASAGDPVDLASGQESYEPGADLTVYNPSGPDVAWSRHYSNDRAYSLLGSAGLPVGWYHPYDIRLEAASYGPTEWPTLFLVYPNGSRQTFNSENLYTPALDADGRVRFVHPPGARFRLSAIPSTGTTKSYLDVTITWADGTLWKFLPAPSDPDQGLLRSITAPTATSDVPQTVILSWEGDENDDYRLTSVANQSDGKTLLSLTYSNADGKGYLLTQAQDCYGRSVVYTNAILPPLADAPAWMSNAPVLRKVSHLDGTGTRVQLSYTGFQGFPLLSAISVPHPNGSEGTAVARIAYDATGRVARTVDGNGNTLRFTYNNDRTTKVETLNPQGEVETFYIARFDEQGRQTGTSDASGSWTYVSYSDTYNPDRPTSISDMAGRSTSISYESNSYGLVRYTTSPRGITTTYTYDYSQWAFGRLRQVQESRGGQTRPAITLDYAPGRAGLVSRVTGPHPNVGAADWNGPTRVEASFAYNEYGDIVTATVPGHNLFGSLTTSYSYTSNGTETFPAKRGQVRQVFDAAGKESQFTYDVRGNVLSARDPLGNVSSTTYNIADQPLETLVPATGQSGSGAGKTSYEYIYPGGLLKTSRLFDESGTLIRAVTNSYGPEGETLDTSGSTEAAQVTYTAFYALKSLRDAKGNLTRYDYDTRGLLRKIVRPDANETTDEDVVRAQSYTSDGQLQQSIDGRGVVSNYHYNDVEGALTNITYPSSGGDDVSLQYDDWGRLARRVDASGQEEYAYSDADELLQTSTNYRKDDGSYLPPLVLQNRYFANGMRSNLRGVSSTPTGRVGFAYTYDERGLLTRMRDGRGVNVGWSYDDNARLSTQTQDGVRSYSYNALGQVTAMGQLNPSGAAQVLFGHASDPQQALLYDGAGNLKREVSNYGSGTDAGGLTNYSYDTNDRLTEESSTRFRDWTRGYGYNSAYGRTSRNGTDFNTMWSEVLTHNAKNQIVSLARTQNGVSTNTAYAYDGEGNRASVSSTNTSGTTTTRYGYDANNHLTLVTSQTGTNPTATVMKAGYRGDGLRAWKEKPSGERVYFLYDGDTLLCEVDGTGTDAGEVRATSWWGADGLVSRSYSPAGGGGYDRSYVWDTKGNIALQRGGGGSVLQRTGGDAFGATGGSSDEAVATFAGQVGGYRDSETGLVLFGQRYYDAGTGSWITRDPIAEAGGINLYSYVTGNPTNFVDPSGLSKLVEWVVRLGSSPAAQRVGPAIQRGLSRAGNLFSRTPAARQAARSPVVSQGAQRLVQNPITVKPGQMQECDPNMLRAGQQQVLRQGNLNDQLEFIKKGVDRYTPIEVTVDGVIVNGHHGVRAAAQLGRTVHVKVVGGNLKPGPPVTQLPVIPGRK